MIGALIKSAAEQASHSQPDYVPAVIGLGGVVVGGVIQVIAQTAKERSARVAEMRADVMDFAYKATVMADNMAEIEGIRRDRPLLWNSFSQEKLQSLSDEHVHNAKEVHKAGTLLAKVSDPRVATYAKRVVQECMRFNNARQGIFALGANEAYLAQATHAKLRRDIDILTRMIAPRRYERHLRFRSTSRAATLVDRSVKSPGRKSGTA